MRTTVFDHGHYHHHHQDDRRQKRARTTHEMMEMVMATMILSRNKQGPAHTLEPTIKVELTLDGTDCHTFCFAHNDSLHTAQLHTNID